MGRPLEQPDCSELEFFIRAQNQACSRGLLEALMEHHGAPSIDIEPLPEEVPPVEPEPIRPQCPQWFSIVDEVEPTEPKINDIKRAVARHFKIAVIDMESARRTAKIVYPRQVAMYLARSLTRKSLPEIGRRLGGRDHTTILHGARKIEADIRRNWVVAYDVALVEASIFA